MANVCEEYLDVINSVIRDAYYYTYPRIILAERYLNSYGSYGLQTGYSEDRRWRQDVMERAFKRMAQKDDILRRKYSDWELHPDFEAKRFYKVRESSGWVPNIYSSDTSEQGRSRIALLSLEKFLAADIGRISGDHLIKLFGWSAGEGYDNLQIPKTVKTEPESLSSSADSRNFVDLTETPLRIGSKRKRADCDVNNDDSSGPKNSEPSSPMPLSTSMPRPPPSRPTTPSLEIPEAAEAGIINSQMEVATRPQHNSAKLDDQLSRVPWLVAGVAKLQARYPEDRFEVVAHEGTLRLKCHDCPKNLYKAIYPNRKLWSLEAHLKTPLHRYNVNVRIRALIQSAGQESRECEPSEDPNLQRNVEEAPGLVMIFPFAASMGGPPMQSFVEGVSRSQVGLADSSGHSPWFAESDDRTKRFRLDLEGSLVSGVSGMKSLEYVDGRPAIRTPAIARKQNNGGAAIKPLLRANVSHFDQIESLHKEHEALALQNSALMETGRRNSKLIIAVERRYDELHGQIKAVYNTGNDLNGRVTALEDSQKKIWPSELAANQEFRQLAHRLDAVESRSQLQVRDIAEARLFQKTTTKSMQSLSTSSAEHTQAIAKLKHSAQLSKGWRSYLANFTQDQMSRLDQFGSELRCQKEDNQNLKKATEGRVDAVIKQHQQESDIVMKRIAALEKMVESQNAQISYLKACILPQIARTENYTSQGEILRKARKPLTFVIDDE